jgi:phosphatidylinositol 4-kinase A
MFGNNRIQLTTDYHLLTSVTQSLDRDPDTGTDTSELKRLLQVLLKDETYRVHTWLSPLANDLSIGPVNIDEAIWPTIVRSAWKVDPHLAVHLSERFVSPSMNKEIHRLVVANPEDVVESPVAAQILLGENHSHNLGFQLEVLPKLNWTNCSNYYIGHL